MLFVWAIKAILCLSHGTSFYVKPFPEAVESAPHIVRVEAVSNDGRWGVQKGGRKQIYTYTLVKVLKVYKGGFSETEVNVRQPGGEVGGVGLQVPGTSKFKTGDEVILFLNSQNSDGSFDVKGMMLGRLNLSVDSKGQEVLSGPAIQWQGQVTSDHGENTSHDQEHGDTGRIKKTWSVNELVELINTQKKNKSVSSQSEKVSKNDQTKTKQKTEKTENSASPLQSPSSRPQGGGGSMEEFSKQSQDQSEEDSTSSLWPLWTLFFVSIFVVLFVLKR